MKIIKGELSSEKIYEDKDTFAFLDINPSNHGHTLVVPKKHSENIYSIDEKALASMMKTVRKLAPAIKKALKADGIHIMMNNDPAAGQIVFHSHIHIVPRFEGDSFKHWKKRVSYKDGEIGKVGEKIRSEL